MLLSTKRILSFGLLAAGIAVLAGCPIYPDDRGNRVCVGSDCYDCPDPYYSSSCFAWSCNSSGDCPSGYGCASDHHCAPTGGTTPGGPNDGALCTKPADCTGGLNCGADNHCHAGDCSASGCPSTYVCKLTGGVPACVPVGGGTGGDGGTTSTCQSDQDCPTPAGSKCLSGECVAPADQCVDGTQCTQGQCVQGACTPSCNANTPCPAGYSCDTAKGVCTNNPTPCTASSSCGGGTVCVEQHCVTPCGAGGTCQAGLVCVDGGCTPDQKPTFTCNADGQQDSCQPGSICLRHSCYIGCDADAGPDACKSADKFNVCKTVTTSSGAHSVCATANNLGSDCDPTQGKSCTSPLVCIDGFCR